MFESTSRYAAIETVRLTTAEGRIIQYKGRRFLPSLEDGTKRTEMWVTQGDRLDLIAARVLGDPEFFWRICDVNPVLNPLELTREPGKRIFLPFS
jgi:hypothetical protein